MLDEIEAHDPLVVLHRGMIRWSGPAADLAGQRSLAEAFLRLTDERP
jgi:ABC-2 type transport system ATP-binding protein